MTSGKGGFGGGGAGFGGAIFAMKGNVTLTDVSFSGNTVTAGSGVNLGSAAGDDIYICTTQDPLCGATVTACGGTMASSVAGGTLTVPVCGCGRDLPANTWLMTAPACTPGPDDIAIQYGDDIPGGVYGTNWTSYKWDAATQSYGSPQAGTDVLLQGTGNWLYSLNAATLALTGIATPFEPCSNYGSGLSGNCFAISLTPSPTASRIWQMVGHPFPYAVNWADVKVAVSHNGGATWEVYSPSQAESAGYVSKAYYCWNGNSYDPYDDVTLGGGTLQPQEAIWVRSLGSYSGPAPSKLKLLIPAR
jgi:hypothetical protein